MFRHARDSKYPKSLAAKRLTKNLLECRQCYHQQPVGCHVPCILVGTVALLGHGMVHIIVEVPYLPVWDITWMSDQIPHAGPLV